MNEGLARILLAILCMKPTSREIRDAEGRLIERITYDKQGNVKQAFRDTLSQP